MTFSVPSMCTTQMSTLKSIINSMALRRSKMQFGSAANEWNIDGVHGIGMDKYMMWFVQEASSPINWTYDCQGFIEENITIAYIGVLDQGHESQLHLWAPES